MRTPWNDCPNQIGSDNSSLRAIARVCYSPLSSRIFEATVLCHSLGLAFIRMQLRNGPSFTQEHALADDVALLAAR
jgi:hypothetical protein